MKATKRLYAAVGKVDENASEILVDGTGRLLISNNRAELIDLANDCWDTKEFYVKVYTSL